MTDKIVSSEMFFIYKNSKAEKIKKDEENEIISSFVFDDDSLDAIKELKEAEICD